MLYFILPLKMALRGITGFWVPLHSPICSLSLLFSPTKFATNKIFPTSAKKIKIKIKWP
jgi:hypothetical protein